MKVKQNRSLKSNKSNKDKLENQDYFWYNNSQDEQELKSLVNLPSDSQPEFGAYTQFDSFN